MKWIASIPYWLKEVPHVAWALLTFTILCALWFFTRDHDVLAYIGTALGLICGLLTGRALATSATPPTEESIKTTQTIERRTETAEPLKADLDGVRPPQDAPHNFVGRLDRDCELCGKPDRDPIHRIELKGLI